MAGKETLTAKEKRGMELFFTEYEPRSGQLGADCFHCHGGANFSDHQLHDNGLGEGIFTTPSLRNLTLTAPYMHDGRFKTLEEVVAHYSGPLKRKKTLDPNLSKKTSKTRSSVIPQGSSCYRRFPQNFDRSKILGLVIRFLWKCIVIYNLHWMDDVRR